MEENILLGKIENDNKTCSWPTPEREAKTIEIINNMQQQIPQELLDNIKNSDLMKIKSKSLYQWGLETALTLENIDKEINLFMIAQDPKTGEITHICHSCDTDDLEKRIDKLVRMINNACYGVREHNNEPVANEIFTIIANVCAAYCAQSEDTFKSFMHVVKYFIDINKEAEEKTKESQT